MSKANSDRRLVSDVEITLSGDQVTESRLSTLKPNHRIPTEVLRLGQKAVDEYQAFLSRVGGRASHIVEHIEVATA